MTDEEWGGDRPSEQEVQEFLDGIDGKDSDLPSPGEDFGTHPTEMFMLQLQTPTGAWVINRMTFTRDDAEFHGARNRARRPWRIHTYRLVDES